MAQSAKNQQRLLTIAKSINPDIIGIGQEPPVIKPTMPDISLLVQTQPIGVSAVGGTYTPIDDQAFDNIKVEPYRTLPVGVLQLKPEDFDAVHDMLDARQLEEQLKMLHLTKLYEAVIAGSPKGAKKIEDALGAVDDEIGEIADILNALESVYLSKSNAEAAFESKKLFAAASSRYVQNCALMNVELSPVEQSMTFLETLSSLSSISYTILEGMNNTAIYYQILADGDHSLRYGVSPSFYIPADTRTKWMKSASGDYKDDGFMKPKGDVAWVLNSTITKYTSIEDVGIGDLGTYSGIQTSADDKVGSATALSELSRIKGLPMIGKVSRAACYLSREFMLSAGFGRMLGTPLGQSFGIGADPVNEIFGMKSVTGLYAAPNTVEPDSIADFAIVDENGNSRPDPTLTKVHLLEGSHQIKDDYETSVTRWLSTIETSPSNNDVGVFDMTLKKALDRLTEAQQLLNPVLCRDHERVLLSPSGLYGRCLSAFSEMLETITVSTEDSKERNKKASQLAALAQAGKFVAQNTGEVNPDNHEWVGAKVIFSLLCRACAVSIVSESEQGTTRVFGDNIPGPRWSYKESSVGWLDEWLKYDHDEKEQLAVSFSLPGASFVYDSRITGGVKGLAQQKGMFCWTLLGEQFLKHITDFETPGTPFNIIAEIFKELCTEAQTAAVIDDGTKSYLRIGATTEHAGFDAAIAMAHLFEIFSEMAATFLDIGVAIPPETRTLAEKLIATPIIKTLVKKSIVEKPIKKIKKSGRGGGSGDDNSGGNKMAAAAAAMNKDETAGSKQQGYKPLDGVAFAVAAATGEGGQQSSKSTFQPVPIPTNMVAHKVLSDEGLIHSIFIQQEVGILFHGGANQKGTTVLSKENKLRRFLNEVVSAIENKDLSTLIDSGGKVNAITNTNASTSFSSHGPDCSAADIIAEARKLMREDDSPAKYFAMAKSIIESLRDQTQALSDKAAQLRLPDVDAPPDIKMVRGLESTDLGKKYIRGLTSVQIAHSRRRLKGFADAVESPYVLEPTSDEVYQALRMLLDYENSSRVGTLNSIIYMGVPGGFYDHVYIADEIDLRSASAKFSISKVDEIFPGLFYESNTVSIPIGIYITDADINAAMQVESPPTNFTTLVTSLTYNEGAEQVSYDSILARSNKPSSTSYHLKNLVRSYLWKRLSDITATTNFESYKSLFLDDQDMSYTPGAQNIMKEFYEHLGLSSDFQFFTKPGQASKLLGVEKYAQIVQPQKTIVDGINGWMKPKGSQAQIDALFDLAVTKPFYVGNLRKIVLTRTVFDEIYALSYDLDSADISSASPYIQSRIQGGAASPAMLDWKLQKATDSAQSSTEGDPNRFSIDSVYVSLDIVQGPEVVSK